jgi:DNA-binding transcriptional LysR family regulator
MKISFDALQVLDAIDNRGSFAAAAQALHRVPSALTHAMKKLEDALGVTLFVREGRRALLTPAGRILLEEGRHLLRAAGELECRVKRVATGWETELRIAVDALIDTGRLLPLAGDFYRELSGTRLRLSCEVLGGCWDALLSGRADLAVGAPGDPPLGGGFRVLPFGTVDFVFVCAPDHPLAQVPEPLAPAAIQRHRAVAVADTSRQLLARSVGILTGQDVLTVPDRATKVAAHCAGLGVGYLARGLAEREAAAGRLLIRQVAEPRAEVTLHLAWRTDHDGKALAWFVERLSQPALQECLLSECRGACEAQDDPARRRADASS